MSKNPLKKKPPKKPKSNKPRPLDEVVAEVRAKYGKNSIYYASDAKFLEVHRQPSGIHAIDFATGGGYPYGRYVHIYGGEGVAKTFIAMLAAATIHRTYPDAVVVWLDLERIFDKRRAAQIGMDLTRTILINEESIEDSIGAAEEFIDVLNVKLFVFDSVAALITIAELENEVEEQTMGVGARLLNRFLRRWTAKNSPKRNKPPHSFVILLNQVREKIQRGGNPNMPPKPQPTGGRGLRFFTSLAIEVAKGDWVTIPTHDDDNDQTVVGHEVKAQVVKNNTFPPNRVCKFMLCVRKFDLGDYGLRANSVDNARDLVRYGKFYELVQEKASWLRYAGKKWQGRLKMQAALSRSPELSERLYLEIMHAINKKLGVLGFEKTGEESEKTGAEFLREARREKATGVGQSVAQQGGRKAKTVLTLAQRNRERQLSAH